MVLDTGLGGGGGTFCYALVRMSTDFITQKKAKAHKKCSFSSKTKQKTFVISVGEFNYRKK